MILAELQSFVIKIDFWQFFEASKGINNIFPVHFLLLPLLK